MTMRVGLLTYHHVVNIGSVLQTYCSYNLLCMLHPGAQVEIIDHVPAASERFKERLRKKKSGGLFSGRNDFARSEIAYDGFLRERCNFGPALGVTDDAEQVVQAIMAAGYDRVFVGSDTVFQLDGYFGASIAATVPPNAYFLPGSKGFQKIGLAASFDPYVPNQASNEALQRSAAWLRGFDFVLYRDRTARALLEQAGVEGRRMAHVPDPTILMDITHLVPPLKANRLISSKPKAGVAIADERLLAQAKAWAREAGCEVIDFMHPPMRHDRASGPAGAVGEALDGYRDLDVLITDRFHGSILALQVSDAAIIGVESATAYTEPNGKLRDLYDRLQLGDRLLRSGPDGLDKQQFQHLLSTKQCGRAEMLERFAVLRAQGFASLVRAMRSLEPAA